uniref:Uncharacterized protein n=1 Tax=Molossus molossus TaxID=27622 RepID=A0A7J8BLC0_MOLMO|nr:hypothetical protein HJG59_010171 [Molossus molossus]
METGVRIMRADGSVTTENISLSWAGGNASLKVVQDSRSVGRTRHRRRRAGGHSEKQLQHPQPLSSPQVSLGFQDQPGGSCLQAMLRGAAEDFQAVPKYMGPSHRLPGSPSLWLVLPSRHPPPQELSPLLSQPPEHGLLK